MISLEKGRLLNSVILAYCATLLLQNRSIASTLYVPPIAPPLPHIEVIGDQNVTTTYEGSVILSRIQLVPTSAVKTYGEQLQRDFPPPWKFVDAQARYGDYSLQGEFQAHVYTTCGNTSSTRCIVDPLGNYSLSNYGGPSLALGTPYPTSVGALLIMEYKPKPGDPSSIDSNYLQMVNSSYADDITRGNCNYPENTWIVDRKCNAATPFYLESLPSLVGSGFYVDRPIYSRAEETISFYADTFLAKPGPNQLVTLYDGVTWGWINQIDRISAVASSQLSPLPPSQPLARIPRNPPCPAGMPIQSCIAFGYDYGGGIGNAQVQTEEIATSQLSFDEPSAAPEAVPTPALLPGMIATGIYHGRKWRKRKQRNQENDSDNIAA